MAYGKGRATSYTDFYKQNDKTPGEEEAADTITPRKIPRPWQVRRLRKDEKTVKADSTNNSMRKAALQRRLAMKRAGK